MEWGFPMGYIKNWERKIIEHELNKKTPVADIAQMLDRHRSTIYKEIKRGTVTLLHSDLTEYAAYKADVGERVQTEHSHNKGVELKIGNDIETADYIEKLILEKKYAPYAVSVELRKNPKYTSLSKGTIYNYIKSGVFLNVTMEKLFYKPRGQSFKPYKKVSYRFMGAKSIDRRGESIKERSEFGHWELDTVYSGKEKSKACLLVFTERMTRIEIVRKIKDRTARSVIKAINALERHLTAPVFRRIFKTITCDNGVEFSAYDDIEKSCINKRAKRTSVYFCHPYSSYERGSNENANKLIRKFIPKGFDIGKLSHADVRRIETEINDYPREMFGGLSSNEYFLTLGII